MDDKVTPDSVDKAAVPHVERSRTVSVADKAVPTFKLQVDPSKKLPGQVGLFPLYPIAKGEVVFHFEWRDHPAHTPISSFPEACQPYLRSLWAKSGRQAVPAGKLLDPVCFLNPASEQPSVFFDAERGDYLAARDLTTEDEITFDKDAMASRLAQSAEDDTESVATTDGLADALKHIRLGSPCNVLRVRVGVSKIKPSMEISFATIIFAATMFFVNIVLLNMLIALMNDTWSRYKNQEEYLGLKGRAQLLVELEARMGKRTLAHEGWFPRWLHVIKKGPSRETSEEGSTIDALPMDPPRGDPQLSPTERILQQVDLLARKQDALAQTHEAFSSELENKIARLEVAIAASAREEQLRAMSSTLQEVLLKTNASSTAPPLPIPRLAAELPLVSEAAAPSSPPAGSNASPRRRRFLSSLSPRGSAKGGVR